MTEPELATGVGGPVPGADVPPSNNLTRYFISWLDWKPLDVFLYSLPPSCIWQEVELGMKQQCGTVVDLRGGLQSISDAGSAH